MLDRVTNTSDSGARVGRPFSKAVRPIGSIARFGLELHFYTYSFGPEVRAQEPNDFGRRYDGCKLATTLV